jgi:hypothetical protein
VGGLLMAQYGPIDEHSFDHSEREKGEAIYVIIFFLRIGLLQMFSFLFLLSLSLSSAFVMNF